MRRLTGLSARADDPAMERGLDLHFGAVIVGVFVDQIGSFAMGAAIAVVAVLEPWAGAASRARTERRKLVQALYEASCIVFGVIGGFTAARLARRSMVAHGVATSMTSLGVSTALGFAMNQEMFDARGIFFAAVALAAGPLGGWLASLLPLPISIAWRSSPLSGPPEQSALAAWRLAAEGRQEQASARLPCQPHGALDLPLEGSRHHHSLTEG